MTSAWLSRVDFAPNTINFFISGSTGIGKILLADFIVKHYTPNNFPDKDEIVIKIDAANSALTLSEWGSEGREFNLTLRESLMLTAEIDLFRLSKHPNIPPRFR